MKRTRIAALIAIGIFGGSAVAGAGIPQTTLPTPAEKASYREYTQYEAVVSFLSTLRSRAPELGVATVGRSLPTERYGARDIFLAVLGGKGAVTPESLDRTKPTVLFTAAQHGNEQSAKEAVLWLLRDLAAGELKPLLAKVNVLVMPQTNPHGNFLNVRVNELDLDMNRDHVKVEAEGVRAIHRVFGAFRPEVTIDVHEKGDDYYRVSIGCVSNVNIAEGLQDFSRRVVLAEVGQALKKKNFTFHEYLVTEDLGVDTSSGSARPEVGRGPREEMKRFSTTDLNDGRNSLGIFETLSFIQEGASRHDLDTLKARTTWQYNGLLAFLESVAAHAPGDPEDGRRSPRRAPRTGGGPGRRRSRPPADEVRPGSERARAQAQEVRAERGAVRPRSACRQEGGGDGLAGRFRSRCGSRRRQGRR